MWLHADPDAYPGIILHDCCVSEAALEDDTLSFSFADGFWITTRHPRNPTGKVMRTGPSEMIYTGFAPDGCEGYLFERDPKRGETRRREFTLATLLEKINRGRWELELVEEYYGFGSALLWGEIRQDEAPCRLECQLALRYSQAVYCWNEWREDRLW